MSLSLHCFHTSVSTSYAARVTPNGANHAQNPNLGNRKGTAPRILDNFPSRIFSGTQSSANKCPYTFKKAECVLWQSERVGKPNTDLLVSLPLLGRIYCQRIRQPSRIRCKCFHLSLKTELKMWSVGLAWSCIAPEGKSHQFGLENHGSKISQRPPGTRAGWKQSIGKTVMVESSLSHRHVRATKSNKSFQWPTLFHSNHCVRWGQDELYRAVYFSHLGRFGDTD